LGEGGGDFESSKDVRGGHPDDDVLKGKCEGVGLLNGGGDLKKNLIKENAASKLCGGPCRRNNWEKLEEKKIRGPNHASGKKPAYERWDPERKLKGRCEGGWTGGVEKG